MKVLELYAGSRSIGRAAEKLGCEVFSVDWTAYEDIDLVMDIENITPEHIPFIPDFIWLSPDCTTYTVAALGTHRNGTEPKTDYARKCDRTNKHTLKLIQHYLQLNPNLIFYIENPRGMMRKMPFMISGGGGTYPELTRATAWYCTYSDDRAKPTDIFSNNIYDAMFNPNGWRPRPECHNGNKNCHHQSAPRSSNSGTEGKKGSYDKSKIPEQLCIEILTASLAKFNSAKQ